MLLPVSLLVAGSVAVIVAMILGYREKNKTTPLKKNYTTTYSVLVLGLVLLGVGGWMGYNKHEAVSAPNLSAPKLANTPTANMPAKELSADIVNGFRFF